MRENLNLLHRKTSLKMNIVGDKVDM